MKACLLEIACLSGVLLLVSCGQPGSPQPPSLELPKAVENLTATRKGNVVTLRWLPPNRFTDNKLIKRVGPTNICRSPGSTPAASCNASAKLAPKAENIPDRKGERPPAEYQDQLPQKMVQGSPTGSVMYSVEVLNAYGRSVGLSNQVEVSTAPAVAPPASISLQLGDTGVTVSWPTLQSPAIESLTYAMQISRQAEGGDFETIATVPLAPAQYLDATIPWEKNLAYRVAVLTQRSSDKQTMVEGSDSAAANIFTHDTFPPAQPSGLQAVFSGPGQQLFIDLSWVPNLEADLAGYNVFRKEEGGTMEKLNHGLVTAPSYRDEHVQAGRTYVYTVNALDARGNESPQSAETSEPVPQ